MQPKVRRFEITAEDGLILRGEVFGDRVAPGTPVICLPGLTRNSRDFHPLAERLASDPDNPRFVMILNSRGRGPSDYDKHPENYTILTEAQDAIHALAAAGLSEAVFIGTSRGGLLTMAVAAMRPNLIAGAILNDIGPIIDRMGIARIKTYLTRAKPVETWEDAIAYSKMANASQFTNMTEDLWQQFAAMTFRDEDGLPKRDFDIYIAKSLEGVDLSEPTTDFWPQFLALSYCPLLVLRGENSDILPEHVAQEMIARHPDAQLYIAKQQGHAPLFLFDALNDRVAQFLAEVDAKREIHTAKATPAWLDEEDIDYIPRATEDTMIEAS